MPPDAVTVVSKAEFSVAPGNGLVVVMFNPLEGAAMVNVKEIEGCVPPTAVATIVTEVAVCVAGGVYVAVCTVLGGVPA